MIESWGRFGYGTLLTWWFKSKLNMKAATLIWSRGQAVAKRAKTLWMTTKYSKINNKSSDNVTMTLSRCDYLCSRVVASCNIDEGQRLLSHLNCALKRVRKVNGKILNIKSLKINNNSLDDVLMTSLLQYQVYIRVNQWYNLNGISLS